MEETVFVGIDIGTNKICTLVARVEDEERIRILGLGIEPSRGMRKGAIVDLAAATRAITHSIDKAERTSGLEINSALVTLAGSQISAVNSNGVVGINGRPIGTDDIVRAMDSARAVAIPNDQEIIHIIQRNFKIDGQDGIRTPVGMHGFRLEVEAHIITAPAAVVENLRHCVMGAGVDVSQFVLNPLAAAEMALTESEREMGVVVCDVGGGTTDIAIYIEGDVWHTAVLTVAGDHISSDIAHGLHLATEQAERIKQQHGHASKEAIGTEEYFTVRPFGQSEAVRVSRRDLAHIINARTEEIFGMVQQEIKRSGYDGLLPAGMVLTGGTAMLPGIQHVAGKVLGMPVRVARPEKILGMVDQLNTPAFAASVGLVKWGMLMNEISIQPRRDRLEQGGLIPWQKIKDILKRMLP